MLWPTPERCCAAKPPIRVCGNVEAIAEILIPAGKTASFATVTSRTVGGHNGAAEILSILDHHGERAHLHD